MWNNSIVEETRRLRDEYSEKHDYNTHTIVEDLKQWEQQGFPTAADPDKALQPIVLPLPELRQNGG